jgi:hypothetical protein
MAFKTIIIHFDNSGEQRANGGLVVTVQGGGSKTFNNGQGVNANPSDPAQNALWGGHSSLELVDGSNCVVIGGRKYCV